MAALQAFGPGGWPMSLFLTPDGRPFFGGTYFPPRDKNGSAGFLTIVKAAWPKPGRSNKPKLTRRANDVTEAVRKRLKARQQLSTAAAIAIRRGPRASKQLAGARLTGRARRVRLQPNQSAAGPSSLSRSRSTCCFCFFTRTVTAAKTNGARRARFAMVVEGDARSDGREAASATTSMAAISSLLRPSRYWLVPHSRKDARRQCPARVASASPGRVRATFTAHDSRWRDRGGRVATFFDFVEPPDDRARRGRLVFGTRRRNEGGGGRVLRLDA